MKKLVRRILAGSIILVSLALVLAACPENPPEVAKVYIFKGSMTNGDIEIPASAEKGKTVTVTPKPDPGFTANGIVIDPPLAEVPELENGKYTFKMPAYQITITVSFRRFTVTKEAMENGDVTIAPASPQFEQQVTLTVAPATGYEFKQWAITPASVVPAEGAQANRFTFDMPGADVVIKAIFSERATFDITKQTTTGIDFTIAPGVVVAKETKITLTVGKPDAGYAFDGWTVTPNTVAITEESAGTWTFNMPMSDVTIKAKVIELPTEKLAAPTIGHFRINTNGSFEMDRNGTGSGGMTPESARAFDGTPAIQLKYVKEERVYVYGSTAEANAATFDIPGGLGHFSVIGDELINPDDGTSLKGRDDPAGGGGYQSSGNYYCQIATTTPFLQGLLGEAFKNGLYFRAQFIAVGDDRSFDSDLGPVTTVWNGN